MMHHGLEQSSRIVIDAPNLTDAYMKRVIKNRMANGDAIDEVWLRNEDGSIKRLIKKFARRMKRLAFWQRIGSH